MLVNVQLREGGYIDSEAAFLRKRSGHPVVKPVDALNHQHVPLRQTKVLSLVLPLPCLEVEGRKLNVLSFQKICHIAAEKRKVDGIE